jgi:hypothetical protein
VHVAEQVAASTPGTLFACSYSPSSPALLWTQYHRPSYHHHGPNYYRPRVIIMGQVATLQSFSAGPYSAAFRLCGSTCISGGGHSGVSGLAGEGRLQLKLLRARWRRQLLIQFWPLLSFPAGQLGVQDLPTTFVSTKVALRQANNCFSQYSP